MRFNEFRDPADQEPAYNKDFKQDSLFNQLGKVLDSQGNPKPVDTVITDDNKQFKVTVAQAQMLRNLMTSNQIKPALRGQFTRDAQGSTTLAKFLSAPDMITLFGQMYMNVDDGGAQDESLWVGGSGKVKGRVKGGGRKRTPKLPGIKGGPKTGPTANVALAN
jgi:hypothetical protein|tara:strand:- start:2020 stop:2508 length:489 start_codon:yes stop_codon:yes gene_type:complete